MKRIVTIVLSAVLAVPLMSTAVVFAIESSGNEPTTKPPARVEPKTGASTQTKVALGESEKAPTADELKLLQARTEKRKAELKVKLTNAEKLNVQNKCKAAQGLVSSVKGRAKGLETSRSQVNENIVSQLTKLSEKLKAKSIDTSTLDADIAALKTKITTFNTDLTIYKQAVGDVADMDCKADPDGFKASLAAARTALENANKDNQAIKSYVKDTIKPLLKTLRAKLVTEQETDKTGGNQ